MTPTARRKKTSAAWAVLFPFLLGIFAGFRADAIPWRERDALRSASSLPERLIDSIMARGNWDILFQKSPFREFQRQLAVAEHFSLQGDTQQAEYYLKRAGVALDIAYASLRGRFEWPRSPKDLKADDLPWGENRDTFRDYVLCRLQYYLESGLHQFSIGRMAFEKLSEEVEQAERQLAQNIAERDGDLAVFIRLLREAVELRQATKISHGARALRFRASSSQMPSSARSYWGRKSILLQLREHIRYGNLGLAQALIEFLQNSEVTEDRIAMARFFIQSSNYTGAISIMQEEFSRKDLRRSESYADFVRVSEMLQNALVWQKRYAEAAVIAQESNSVLASYIAENRVSREELLSVRRSASNQKLRNEILRYLATGECPTVQQVEHDDALEISWRIRERFFYELCGYPRVKEDWQKWLNDKNVDADAAQLVRFALGIPIDKKKANNDSIFLLKVLSFYDKLIHNKITPAKRRENALSLLVAAGAVQPDLVLLDWGIKLPDNMVNFALGRLQGKLAKADAALLFIALHQAYALKELRGTTLNAFAPEDAAFLAARASAWILGSELENDKQIGQTLQGNLLYADENSTLFYSAQTETLRIYRKMPELTLQDIADITNQPARAFGGALAYAARHFPAKAVLAPMPVYARCGDCAMQSRLPSRLLTVLPEEKNWQKTRTELEDIFSAHTRLHEAQVCNFTGELLQDTIITTTNAAEFAYPCTLFLTDFIFELEETLPSPTAMALLAAAPGWKSSAILFLPKAMDPMARTAFLFDFLQRRRKTMNSYNAFAEALERAEKSFSAGSGLEAVKMYASLD